MIHYCELRFSNEVVNCSELFTPGPSLSGLVYSLNQAPLQTLITEEANDLYSHKLIQSSEVTKESLIPPGSFQLQAVLLPDLSHGLGEHNFYLSIHEREKMPDLIGNPIRLEPGNEYIIKIKASQTLSDSSVISMPLAKRKCLFAHESEGLNLFRNYSRPNCLMECLSKVIIDRCQCLPWDYMRHRDLPNIRPCISIQSGCVNTILEASSDYGCNCPFECNMVKYSYSIQPKQWNAETYCAATENIKENNFVEQNKWGTLHYHKHNPFGNVHFPYRDYTSGQYPNGPTQDYLNLASKGVRIDISYEDSSVQQTTKLKRVTFAGMLSNLGEIVISSMKYIRRC